MVGQQQHTSLPRLRWAVQTLDLIPESWSLLTNGQQFTIQNLDQLYVLVSYAHKTTSHDITRTVLKAM